MPQQGCVQSSRVGREGRQAGTWRHRYVGKCTQTIVFPFWSKKKNFIINIPLISKSGKEKLDCFNLAFWHLLSHFICTVYLGNATVTSRTPVSKNKCQEGKSMNRKLQRWLQAGAGLSRSRRCAERCGRSSPRTPAAARQSRSPCLPCAGYTGRAHR